MDTLSESKQSAIRKMRTVRLANELLKRGYNEEEVDKMNRSMLEEEWANIVAAGKDTPPEANSPEHSSDTLFYSSQQNVEQERLAFEQRKYEEEKKERKEREEREERERMKREEREERERMRREEKEEKEREREREERRKREEKEEEERKREFQLKTQQLDIEKARLKHMEEPQRVHDEKRATRRSLASRIKFFNEALKGTIGRMPANNVDLPGYFLTMERLFETVDVDPDVRASILLSNLNEKARTLVSRLTTHQLGSYTELKQILLRENKVSPVLLREQFLTARKAGDETYATLAARLYSTLDYYLQSCNIEKNYENLVHLLCSDMLKEQLPREALHFILSQEKESWMKPDKIADAVDTFLATRYIGGEPSRGHSSAAPHDHHSQKVVQASGSGQAKKIPSSSFRKTEPQVNKDEAYKKGLCYTCGGQGHRSFECGKTKRAEADKKEVKIQACAVTSPEVTVAELGEKVNGLSSSRTTEANTPTPKCVIDTDEFHPRTYVNVNIEGLGPQRALLDSGSEVCCVKRALVEHLQLPIHRQIRVIGMNGQAETAHVVRVHARPVLDGAPGLVNIAPAVRIWMASVEGLSDDVIITPSVMSALQEAATYNVMATQSVPEVEHPTDAPEDSTAEEAQTNDYNTNTNETRGEISKESQGGKTLHPTQNPEVDISGPECVNSNRSEEELPVFLDSDQLVTSPEARTASTEAMAKEQRNCEQLKPCFEQVKLLNNSKFYLKENVLFRRDQIVGHKIEQLCLPQSRIGVVLESAHSAPFSGHMGVKSTMDRIRLSFWFPRLEERVKEHCSSCHVCQLRAPVKVAQRVPIQAIPRNDELPFTAISADCIGPLVPDSDPTLPKPEYNYAIVMVDRFSRWPMAYPLRTLRAEAVCG